MVGQGSHRLAAHRAGLALDQLVDQPLGLLHRSGSVERVGRFVEGGLGLAVERPGLSLGCLRVRADLDQLVEPPGELVQLGPLIADPVQHRLIGTVGRGHPGCVSLPVSGARFVRRGLQTIPDPLGLLLRLSVRLLRLHRSGGQTAQPFSQLG